MVIILFSAVGIVGDFLADPPLGVVSRGASADVARERDMTIDQSGFEKAMDVQRKQAQQAGKFGADYNDQIKSAKLDDLERWREFGGQPVWRAPLLKANNTANNTNATVDLDEAPDSDYGLKVNQTEIRILIKKKIANINAPSVDPPSYDNDQKWFSRGKI